MNPLVTQAVATVVEYRNDIIDFFFGDNKEPVVKKKRDTTKITQSQFKFIMTCHDNWIADNKPYPKYKLVEQVNTALGLNKSMSVYSRIWSGELPIEKFVKG